jgi:hypothetical protein
MADRAPTWPATLYLRLLIDGIFSDATSAKLLRSGPAVADVVCLWNGPPTFPLCASATCLLRQMTFFSPGSFGLRYLWSKTSHCSDQGSFVTCPLHAVAIALAMETFPSTSLLDHPNLVGDDLNEHFEVSSGICLAEALNQWSYQDLSVPSEAGDEDSGANTSEEISGSRPAKRQSQPGLKIHAYVNRITKALSERQQRGGLTTGLSSHSFRRGEAQHANIDASLSAQRIFARHSWNMTTKKQGVCLRVQHYKRRPEGVKGTQRVGVSRQTSNTVYCSVRLDCTRKNSRARS